MGYTFQATFGGWKAIGVNCRLDSTCPRSSREVAPVYPAVDLGDSGPPRWRTFARKRLLELARELGPAAIEEILPGTRAGDLRSAKYVEAATTGWPP